jgi:hypothetical protein
LAHFIGHAPPQSMSLSSWFFRLSLQVGVAGVTAPSGTDESAAGVTDPRSGPLGAPPVPPSRREYCDPPLPEHAPTAATRKATTAMARGTPVAGRRRVDEFVWDQDDLITTSLK